MPTLNEIANILCGSRTGADLDSEPSTSGSTKEAMLLGPLHLSSTTDLSSRQLTLSFYEFWCLKILNCLDHRIQKSLSIHSDNFNWKKCWQITCFRRIITLKNTSTCECHRKRYRGPHTFILHGYYVENKRNKTWVSFSLKSVLKFFKNMRVWVVTWQFSSQCLASYSKGSEPLNKTNTAEWKKSISRAWQWGRQLQSAMK